MKHLTLAPLVLAALSFLCCVSHTNGKLYGFAFKGETITILDKGKVLLNFNVAGPKDSIGVCSINEDLKVPNERRGAALMVQIISNRRTIWDTSVTVPGDNKEPFLSIMYPSAIAPARRGLFVGDASKDVKF